MQHPVARRGLLPCAGRLLVTVPAVRARSASGYRMLGATAFGRLRPSCGNRERIGE